MYEIAPGDDFKPISQVDEIRNLRAEIRELTSRLDDSEFGLFQIPAPSLVMQFLICQARTGQVDAQNSCTLCSRPSGLPLKMW